MFRILVRKLILKRKEATLVGALFLVSMGFLFLNRWEMVKGSSIQGISLSPEEVFESVAIAPKWVLLGQGPDQKSPVLSVVLKESLPSACLRDVALSYSVLETDLSGSLAPSDFLTYEAGLALSSLAPGKYQISAQFFSPCGTFDSQAVEAFVSYPLYVAWTLDWEGYDVKQAHLDSIDATAQKYALPITHFFNPRIYTRGKLTAARQDYLTAWVKERENDSIGLHLHMFKDMVEAAGVTPHEEPAWGITSFHDEGYDVPTSSYTLEEQKQMLSWAKNIFAEKGLGTPLMFRAGGWFADETTLKALADSGFLLDSSGRTKYTLGSNKLAGAWDLSPTTQPYQSHVWEFPNNGGDSWAFSTEAMYQRFLDNFGGAPLSEKKLVTYLSHPQWFDKEGPKMEALFAQIEEYLYAKGDGPVVYITLDQALEIWSSQ